MALQGELRLRTGEKRNMEVKTERDLASLREGIKELNGRISELLTELTELERGEKNSTWNDEEEDTSDDEIAERTVKISAPPAKKSKVLKI